MADEWGREGRWGGASWGGKGGGLDTPGVPPADLEIR